MNVYVCACAHQEVGSVNPRERTQAAVDLIRALLRPLQVV